MMALRDYLNMTHPTSTWYGHTLVAVAGGVLVHLLGLPFWGGCWMAFYYFLIREQYDKAVHQAIGDYDTPREGVSPRADYHGDVLGPLAIAIGATLATLLTG